MTVQRLVSPFESSYFRRGEHPDDLPLADVPMFVATVFRGRLDPGLVHRALRVLAGRHPLLRCRPVDGDEGLLLRLDDTLEPWLGTGKGGEEAYLRVVNSRFDWEHGLFGAHLLHDDQESRLILAMHHGVADGRSGFALLDHFWRCYTALAEGADIPVEARTDLPPAVDTLLSREFGEAEPDALAEAVASAQGGPEPLTLRPEGPGRPLPGSRPERFTRDLLQFDTETTAALTALARHHRITVNSLITGAVLSTVRALAAAPAGRAPVICGHAVDLRGRLGTRIPADTVVNCVAGFVTPAMVSADDDPVELGRRVAAQVRAADERRDVERFLLAALRGATGRQAQSAAPKVSYGLSNIGRLPAYRVPEGIRPVRAEAHGNAAGMPPKVCSIAYEGRLTLQNEYDTWLYTPAQMRRFGQELRTRLEKAVVAAPSQGTPPVARPE